MGVDFTTEGRWCSLHRPSGISNRFKISAPCIRYRRSWYCPSCRCCLFLYCRSNRLCARLCRRCCLFPFQLSPPDCPNRPYFQSCCRLFPIRSNCHQCRRRFGPGVHGVRVLYAHGAGVHGALHVYGATPHVCRLGPDLASAVVAWAAFLELQPEQIESSLPLSGRPLRRVLF